MSNSDTGKPCPTCGKYTTNPYNDLGECITCGRDRILGPSVTPPEQGVKESLTPADKPIRIAVAWNSNASGKLWANNYYYLAGRGYYSTHTWGTDKTYPSFEAVLSAYRKARRGFKGNQFVFEEPNTLPTQSESELGADKELRDMVANSGLPYGRPRGDLYRAVRALIAQRERAARIEETWELEDHLTRHALDTSVGQKAIEFLNRRRDELTKGDK